MKNDKAVSSFKYHKNSTRHKRNLNIIKLAKKWKRNGKGTIRTQITKGKRNKNETECLQNRRVIKKLAKGVDFMARKHLTARGNYEELACFVAENLEEKRPQVSLTNNETKCYIFICGYV